MAVENSKVLIIVNNWGIEETELTRPLRDLKAAGAKVTLAATTLDPCETVQHDRYEGETLTPDARLSDVQAADYDLLVVPGGTCNVDRIRVNEDAITLAQEFAHEGKPIAAICHGAWLLVNAGLVAGKTAAPCRYIAADIENAGGHYVDEHVVVLGAAGREAHAAVAHQCGGDPVRRRRRQPVRPDGLTVVVGVQVDEARERDRAAPVDHLGAVGSGDRLADLDDLTVGDQDVDLIAAVGPDSAEQQRFPRHGQASTFSSGRAVAESLPTSSRSRTAIRTCTPLRTCSSTVA